MKTFIVLDILSNPKELPKYRRHSFHCECDLPIIPIGGAQIAICPGTVYDQFADVYLNYIDPKEGTQQVCARRIVEDQTSADAIAEGIKKDGFWKNG